MSAYNEIFESQRSATIEIIAATLPAKPDPVVRASAGETEIGISWTAPDDGDSDILSYSIESDGGTGGQFSEIATTGAATTTYLHTDLNNGVVYAYRVIAINEIGESEPSDPVSLRAAISPDPPSAPRKTYADGTRIEIEWDPPAGNGGDTITKYEVFMDDTSGSGFQSLGFTTDGSVTSWVQTDSIIEGQPYYFKVVAFNSIAQGSLSPASEKIIAATIPS